MDAGLEMMNIDIYTFMLKIEKERERERASVAKVEHCLWRRLGCASTK